MRDRWKGDTVCVVACGPSLTAADAEYAAARARRLIVVNESWRLAPAADALYAADYLWWIKRGPPPSAFSGERWTTPKNWTDTARRAHKALHWIETKAGSEITEDAPICTGGNSSFQAMALAVLWGARRIVFLGLDLKLGPNGRDHWFGSYNNGLRSPRNALGTYAKAFNHAAPQLVARGVEVVNASRDTVLTCFPRMSLEAALS